MPAKIYFKKGDITEMAVDAIVNSANTELVMGSGLAGAVRRKGGERIEEECERRAPIRLGEAAVTTGANLKAYYVIHAAVIRRGENATPESIRLATHNALLRVEEKTFKSLALPALGTGAGGVSVERSAQAMLSVVLDHIKVRSSLEKIYFVLFDDTAYKVFEETYQRLSGQPCNSVAINK